MVVDLIVFIIVHMSKVEQFKLDEEKLKKKKLCTQKKIANRNTSLYPQVLQKSNKISQSISIKIIVRITIQIQICRKKDA